MGDRPLGSGTVWASRASQWSYWELDSEEPRPRAQVPVAMAPGANQPTTWKTLHSRKTKQSDNRAHETHRTGERGYFHGGDEKYKWWMETAQQVGATNMEKQQAGLTPHGDTKANVHKTVSSIALRHEKQTSKP